EQCGLHAPFLIANNCWLLRPFPSEETSRPWQPPGGLPMPEIHPQDIRSLEWGAVKLFQAVGEEAVGPVETPAPVTRSDQQTESHLARQQVGGQLADKTDTRTD